MQCRYRLQFCPFRHPRKVIFESNNANTRHLKNYNGSNQFRGSWKNPNNSIVTFSDSLRNCSSANYFQPLATLQDNNDLPGKYPRTHVVTMLIPISTLLQPNGRTHTCGILFPLGSLGPLNVLGGTLELAGCPMMLVLSRIQFLIGRSHPLVECLTEQRMNLGPGLSGVSGLCSASAGLVLGENAF